MRAAQFGICGLNGPFVGFLCVCVCSQHKFINVRCSFEYPLMLPFSQQQLHLTAALCAARTFVVVYLGKAIWLLLERRNNNNSNCRCFPKVHAQSISIFLYLLDTYVSTVVFLSLFLSLHRSSLLSHPRSLKIT